MKQIILCRKCKQPHSERINPNMKKSAITQGTCKLCKEKLSKQRKEMLIQRNKTNKMRTARSRSMKKKNPMYDKAVAKKVSETFKKKYKDGELTSSFLRPNVRKQIENSIKDFWASEKSSLTKQKFSKRMRRSNPMYDKATAAKVGSVRKQQIADGVFIPRRGKNHWNWKGNRPFSYFVRSRLYKTWNLPILKRDGFACTICGSKKRKQLHVHHLRPFADIIQSVFKEHNITDIGQILIDNPDFYSQLADQIVSEHFLSDGVTVCKKCHHDIDPNYKSHQSEKSF